MTIAGQQQQNLPLPDRSMFPEGESGDRLYRYILELISRLGMPATGTGDDEIPRNVDLSSGTTGGTGSAGAGNQFVEITLRGVTYKMLHDGTV